MRLNVDFPALKVQASKIHGLEGLVTHYSGVVCGWATAGLISAKKSDEYQNRINKAICSRIKELLA